MGQRTSEKHNKHLECIAIIIPKEIDQVAFPTLLPYIQDFHTIS